MKVLLHMNPDPVSCVVDGILHTLQPGEPYEVEQHIPTEQGSGLGSEKAPDVVRTNADFIGKRIAEHLWWAGVVEVPVVRNGAFGFSYKVDEAREAALAELSVADQKTFQEYVEIQQQRSLEGRPPLVPVGRYLTVIQRRNIDIRKYGINPVGAATVEEQSAQGMEVAKLKADNETLRLEIGRTQEMVQQLLAQMSENEKKSKKA